MIKIKVQALTKNAWEGIRQHLKETTTISNRIKLKTLGITQSVDFEDQALVIDYKGVYEKVVTAIKRRQRKDPTEFYKTNEVEDSFKREFNKDINKFMLKQGVKATEYNVVYEKYD